MLLNKIMNSLVEENVKYYKTDLKYDIETLSLKNEYTEFIWILRKCGTNIYHIPNIFVKNSPERLSLNYYLDNKDFVKIYKITVSKKGVKNIYGEIENITEKKLLKYLSDNSSFEKKIKAVKCTLDMKLGDSIDFTINFPFGFSQDEFKKEINLYLCNSKIERNEINFLNYNYLI